MKDGSQLAFLGEQGDLEGSTYLYYVVGCLVIDSDSVKKVLYKRIS